jgi:hypothetical protein
MSKKLVGVLIYRFQYLAAVAAAAASLEETLNDISCSENINKYCFKERLLNIDYLLTDYTSEF